MRRLVLVAATLCAVAGVALSSAAQRSPAPPPRGSLTIAAAPGRAAAVSRELARLGAPRHRARRLAAAGARRPGPGRRRAARARRARRRARPRSAGPDQVISQGVERIGADALQVAGPATAPASASPSSTSASATRWRNLLGKELPPLDADRRDPVASTTRAASPRSPGLSNDDSRRPRRERRRRSCGTSRPARATRSSTTTRSSSSRRPSTGSSTAPTASRASTSSCTRTRFLDGPVRRHRRGRAGRRSRARRGHLLGQLGAATTRAGTGRAWPATPTGRLGQHRADADAAT